MKNVLPVEDSLQTKANDPITKKPEVKKKIYSINDNVKQQPVLKVESDGDSARQERLRKVKEKQVGVELD